MATSALAFEPMPPIMQTLLQIFPEENGRFVDEPFGSTPEMPNEAKPLFETFRVVVPTVEDIERNLARLYAASSQFPIKKITRYDKNPGAPGLAGFRGVWCQTEDESQVGFSIVTINQNRFLIWAKTSYYPAFANDSINPKVRDQYARDVSQYLAGIDMKVPDNEAPPASGRGLPEEMEFLPSEELWNERSTKRYEEARRNQATIDNLWGLAGVKAIIPMHQMIARIIAEAPDTVCPDVNLDLAQKHFQYVFDGTYNKGLPLTWEKTVHEGMDYGDYVFALDRFGRIRLSKEVTEGEEGLPVTLFFPGAPLLSSGGISITTYPEWAASKPPFVTEVRPAIYCSYKSVGHLFAKLEQLGFPLDTVLLRVTW